MHTPNVRRILDNADAERQRANRNELTAEQRTYIENAVKDTLLHIGNTPAIKTIHEKLKERQVNNGIRQFAHDIADGKTFAEKDPYLTNLLSTTPIDKAVAIKAAPEPETMLHNPDNLELFKHVVRSLNRPSVPETTRGKKAAQWLAPQLRPGSSETKNLIKLFDDLQILVENGGTRPSDLGTDSTINSTMDQMTRRQTERLRDIAVPGNGRLRTRRNILLGTGAAAVVTGLGFNIEAKRENQAILHDDAPNPQASPRKADMDDEDLFSDARAKLNDPANKDRVAAADWKQTVAKGSFWAGLGLTGMGAITQLVKSFKGRHERTREEMQNILYEMGAVVDLVKTRIDNDKTGRA